MGSRSGCRVVTTSLTARLLLANQLRPMPEIDWTVVSGDPYDDPPEGIEVEVVPIRREFAASDVGAFVQLWRYLRRQRFDLVQTHTPKASFLGLPAARLAGCPAIYTIHGRCISPETAADNLLGWLFERWCCSWATGYWCRAARTSGPAESEDLFPQQAGIPRQRNRAGSVRNPDTGRTRTSARGHDGQPTGTREGLHRFHRAGRLLAGRLTSYISGPSSTIRATLPEARYRRRPMAGIVTFVGPVEDVRPYLASADRGRASFLSRGHPPCGYGGRRHGPAGGGLRHQRGCGRCRSRARPAGPSR